MLAWRSIGSQSQKLAGQLLADTVDSGVAALNLAATFSHNTPRRFADEGDLRGA